jgi:hypothetical protein
MLRDPRSLSGSILELCRFPLDARNSHHRARQELLLDANKAFTDSDRSAPLSEVAAYR